MNIFWYVLKSKKGSLTLLGNLLLFNYNMDMKLSRSVITLESEWEILFQYKIYLSTYKDKNL